MGLMIEMFIGGVIAFVMCVALGLYASHRDRKADDKVWKE